MIIDNVEVSCNQDISVEEIKAYIERGRRSGRIIKSLDISIDGDMVDLDYTYYSAKFDRIRRITGYLVGTLDRFNDAKRAEEKDRVKHN